MLFRYRWLLLLFFGFANTIRVLVVIVFPYVSAHVLAFKCVSSGPFGAVLDATDAVGVIRFVLFLVCVGGTDVCMWLCVCFCFFLVVCV